jgi:hypothetical protein
MKNILGLALSLVASASFAGAFDDTVDSVEVANALAHCSRDVPELVAGYNWIGSVEGKHKKLSKIVDQKTILIQSFRGAGGFGRSEKAAVLKITETITQRPGLADAPSLQDYECQLKKQ